MLLKYSKKDISEFPYARAGHQSYNLHGMILSATQTQSTLTMKIIKLISRVVVILLFCIFSPEKAAAQPPSEIQLHSVKVRLFPELSDSSIYVICDIELADDVSTSQSISFMIPDNVEDYFAASIEQNGLLTALELTTSYQGQWKILQLTSPSNKIRLEYKDPNLTVEGRDRFFQFNWFSFYDVETLELQVQGPVNTGKLESYPELTEYQGVGNSRSYYSTTNGPFPRETLVVFNFWYTQVSSTITNPSLKVEMVEAVTENTPGRPPSPVKLLIWFLVVAVSLITLVGIFYLWFQKNKKDRRERVYHGIGIVNPESQIVFCHECGKRSHPEDKFCSNCGTELRETPRPY